jgi:hypothetical protein
MAVIHIGVKVVLHQWLILLMILLSPGQMVQHSVPVVQQADQYLPDPMVEPVQTV